MSEELKLKLLTYLKYLENTVGKTNDFVAEQTPLLVQEYVKYTSVYNGAILLLGIPFLLTGIWAIYGIVSESQGKARPEFIFPRVIISIFSFGICTACFYSLEIFIKSTFAPRVLVLEYVRDMLK